MQHVYQCCFVLLAALLVGCGGGSSTSTDGEHTDSATIDDGVVNRPVIPSSNGPTTDTSNGSSTTSADANPSTTPLPNPPKTLRDQVAKIVEPDFDPLTRKEEWQINSSALEVVESEVGDDYRRLLPLLSDESVEVRRGAAFYVVEKFEAADPDAVAAFQAALTDEDPTIRHIALQAFKSMPPAVKIKAAPQLITMLESERPTGDPAVDARRDTNRAEVARLLASLESAAHELLPQIIEAARNDPSERVRLACIFAAHRIGETNELVPLYRDVLKSDDNPAVRRIAAYRLEKIGRAAAPAATDLAEALEDNSEEVRKAARDALAAIGEPAVAPLISKLESENAAARYQAIFALGKLGATARPALPSLKKRLEDKDERVGELASAVVKYIESLP